MCSYDGQMKPGVRGGSKGCWCTIISTPADRRKLAVRKWSHWHAGANLQKEAACSVPMQLTLRGMHIVNNPTYFLYSSIEKKMKLNK